MISLVALQTSEALVPGSNLTILAVENSEDGEGHYHRRRIETENKAKCRCFRLGVKIECRTRKFWCESVALCTYVLYIFPLLLWGGTFM